MKRLSMHKLSLCSFVMLFALLLMLNPITANAATKCSSHPNAGTTTKVTKYPTCTQSGTKQIRCAKCNKLLQTVTMSKTGHSMAKYNKVKKAATCTTDGVRVTCCCACNAELSTSTIPKTGHKYGSYKVSIAATCTQKGTDISSCTNPGCSSKRSRATAALGHSIATYGKVSKAATCTQSGINTIHCCRCNAQVGTKTIAKTSHSYGAYVVTKYPTCTSTGTRTKTCKFCKATQTATIAATGHSQATYTKTVTPATCIANGVANVYCCACNKKINTTVISKKGHSYGSWKTTKAATCSALGSKKRTCTVCKYVQTASIAKTAHTSTHSVTIVTRTCETNGQYEIRCNACNAKLGTKTEAKYGHTAKSYTTTVAPTADRQGKKTGKCTRCGKNFTVTLAKVAAKDYDVKFVAADSKERFGYISLNGVKYPNHPVDYYTSPVIVPTTKCVATITEKTTGFDWARFIGNFHMSEDTLGLPLFNEVAGQVLDCQTFEVKCTAFYESDNGNYKYAVSSVGNSTYQNNIKNYGTHFYMMNFLCGSSNNVYVQHEINKIYEKKVGKLGITENADIEYILDSRRVGTPYYANVVCNSKGETEVRRYQYSGDKCYLVKKGILSNKRMYDYLNDKPL